MTGTVGSPVRRVAALAAAALLAVLVPASPAHAATGTVNVKGTITCPDGHPPAGVWVDSSAGRSGFAGLKTLPGTSSRHVRFERQLKDVTLPTTVKLNVGCGTKNGDQWRYVFNGVASVRATATGTVFVALGCSTSSCSTPAKGTAGSTTVNPGADSSQCTWRAAEFWKQMTGSYPAWGGNAGYWDDNAPGKGWNVRSWPEMDTIMVWQPTSGNAAGHVGYVADLRVYNGATQVKIYDRNWVGPGADRNGVWIGIPPGAAFIRVPPRFTTHQR